MVLADCFNTLTYKAKHKHSLSIILILIINGRVAQLVEHYIDIVGVVGSNPIVATISFSRCLGVLLVKDKNAK